LVANGNSTFLPKLLTLVFLSIMLLLLALVFINAVLAAAAASHAIGHDNAFPNGRLLVKLTWDFVITDIAALLIVLGILVGKIRASWQGSWDHSVYFASYLRFCSSLPDQFF
jgi:hypothetical protein